MRETDILITGAGPSGSVAASLLAEKGYRVTVLEKECFPRFSLGESLLPCCMQFMESASMLEGVETAGFQIKTGATFVRGQEKSEYLFSEKSSPGFEYTYQVKRAQFDQLLIERARSQGVQVEFGQQVTGVNYNNNKICVDVYDDHAQKTSWQARFALDASGFGRVFPRLLNLEADPKQDNRIAIFSHLNSPALEKQERESIYIVTSGLDPAVWIWVIPFSDNTCSVGVVGNVCTIRNWGENDRSRLDHVILNTSFLNDIFGSNPQYIFSPHSIESYSASVKSLWGDKFALLGNAGEFIDPIFSSGVTIAMKSSSLAADLVARELNGGTVNWQKEFSEPLLYGINVFREFVNAWYDLRLVDIVYSRNPNQQIRKMICSILAGYVWDTKNPYTTDTERRLSALAEQIRIQQSSTVCNSSLVSETVTESCG